MVFEALNRKSNDHDLNIEQLNLLSKIIMNIDAQMDIDPDPLQSAVSGQFLMAHQLLSRQQQDQQVLSKATEDPNGEA